MTTTVVGLSTVGKIAFLSPKAYAVTPDYMLRDLEDYPLGVGVEQSKQKEPIEHSAALASTPTPDSIESIEFSPRPVDQTTSVDALERPAALAPPEPDRGYPLVTELIAPIEFSLRPVDQTTSVDALENPDGLASPGTEGASPLVAELSESTSPENIEKAVSESSSEDPDYIISPHTIPNSAASPFATTIPLNGVSISHLTEWETFSGYNFGDDINNHFQFDGAVALDRQIQQSITRDNVFTIDQRGTYLQLQTVRTEHETTTTRRFPKTLLGFELQLSLTANCLFPGTDSTQQCTYTPTIETDQASLNDNLTSADVLILEDAGEVVTPESIEAIRQPGFQRGANGQEIGVDLLFPNTGSRSGNSLSDRGIGEREEEVELSPALAFSRVRQIVQANDHETVLARTVRGATGILNTDTTPLNLGVQLVGQLLPDLEPNLEGSSNPANTQMNRNLFLAANNTRLPGNSFTIYQAGMGRAASLDAPPASLRELPAVNFNSLWLGLSPITERSFSTDLQFEETNPPRITTAEGNEGGVGDNVSFVSVIDGETFSTAGLEDFYVQTYLTNFETDVDLVSTQVFSEETNYYPHLSWSGNITNASQSFRYYTGVIAAPTIRAYAGLDYRRNSRNGWRYGASAIGYVNPDRDYYSHFQGNVARRIRLSRNANLTFSGDFRWELDQPEEIGNTRIGSRASFVRARADANWGPLSLGGENLFGGILPNSTQDRLRVNLGLRVSDRFRISGFITPIDQSSSRANYGVNAFLRLGEGRNSPMLVASWRNNEYDLGADEFGRDILSTENVFFVGFRWGAPANPFQARQPRRARSQADQQTENNSQAPQQEESVSQPE